jgi:hypothetical protein
MPTRKHGNVKNAKTYEGLRKKGGKARKSGTSRSRKSR